MQSPSTRNQRLAKGVTACQRCRRRKQKCDLKSPKCSNCENANASCLTYHSGKHAEIPRNYLSNLEAQVEKLTRENQELRAYNAASHAASPQQRHESTTMTAGSPATSDASSNHFQDLVKSVRNVVVEPSRQPKFLGQSSGITLARLVMAAIRVEALPSLLFSEQRPYDPSSLAQAPEASLPPLRAAEHLVEVYFQYRTPHMPIITRSQVKKSLDSAYAYQNDQRSTDRGSEKDIFIAYMVFAIALCDVPNPGGGRPSQSEGCFRSAISWIEKVITYSKSDIETLRAILLLAQFVALCPSRGSLWHLTGTALRLCIDIGLHWESDEQSLNMDSNLLHERRCLWYSTYQFDRVLSITLGRPFGIIDESTNVPLPKAQPTSSNLDPQNYDAHNQLAHNHLFDMSKLESEIKHVLHSQAWTPKLAYPKVNYAVWVHDIQPRLQVWYSSIPSPKGAHPSSIFAYQAYWDAIYHNAVLLLYRPASTVLSASAEETLLSFDASCKLISSIKTLQREGRIDILWTTVHHLFMAGLGVIYGLWHSHEIRARYATGKSISTLQSCASTLSALSESFPGAVGCRDTFDTLSSATVEWLVSSGREELDGQRGKMDFERQMNQILQGLQPGEGVMRGIEGTFLSDEFGFGEMLNEAAQWPDFLDMSFGGGGMEFMNGVGM